MWDNFWEGLGDIHPDPASPAEIKRDHAAAFRTLMGD